MIRLFSTNSRINVSKKTMLDQVLDGGYWTYFLITSQWFPLACTKIYSTAFPRVAFTSSFIIIQTRGSILQSFNNLDFQCTATDILRIYQAYKQTSGPQLKSTRRQSHPTQENNFQSNLNKLQQTHTRINHPIARRSANSRDERRASPSSRTS